MSLKVGDTFIFERTFTVDEVELFAEFSGDKGNHHTMADDQGRLVVHGLLLATTPTKFGGDNNVLARTMDYEFLWPVYTGDKVRCEVEVEKYEKQENNRTSIVAAFLCINQDEKQVLNGRFAGVIL